MKRGSSSIRNAERWEMGGRKVREEREGERRAQGQRECGVPCYPKQHLLSNYPPFFPLKMFGL